MQKAFAAIIFWLPTILLAISDPPDPIYEQRSPSNRDGIGKFYMGREISHVMGHQGAAWLERPERERDERTDLLVEALPMKKGKPILGKITDPKLPNESVDLALIVDVYHELSHPYEMTQKMVEALKPGGVIAFVEYRSEDPTVPIKRLHKMTEEQVKKEMTVHDLEYVETLDILPQQHIILFKKPEK